MKKQKIKKGNTFSLQSLSGGMAGDERFHHRFLIGQKRLNDLGFKTITSKNSLKGIEYLKNNPQKRAEDLMEAIKDPSVKLIVANIGGIDSHRLIPFLDAEIIQNNPKPMIGFSDITSLHLYFYGLGIQTFYGPCVLDGFAENVLMHEITHKSFLEAVLTSNDQVISSSPKWTSEMLNWANEEYDHQKRQMLPETKGHEWFNFKEDISGHLIGGCLDTINQVHEKDFFPKLKHWKNSIIFLETSEEKMTPLEFKKALNKLEKEISVCNGLIFGKPKDETYYQEYLKVAKELIKKPFVFNVNIGHAAPIYTLPYGSIMKLNYQTKEIIIKNNRP